VEVGLNRISGTAPGSETVSCHAIRYKRTAWNWPPPPIQGWTFPQNNHSIVVTAQ
jgi:hypothetical protein